MIKFLISNTLVIIAFVSCATVPPPAETTTPPSSIDLPTDKPFGSRYSSTIFGISFLKPDDWHVEENESGITISSDPSLHVEDNLSFTQGDAIIGLRLVVQDNNVPFDDSTMIETLIHLPPYLPPGKEPAHMITVNGKRIAFAGYGINRPVPYPSYTAMLPLEESAILGYIFTSIANERTFREVFQNIISSIERIDVN